MTSTKSDSTLDKHKREIEKRDNEIADLKQQLAHEQRQRAKAADLYERRHHQLEGALMALQAVTSPTKGRRSRCSRRACKLDQSPPQEPRRLSHGSSCALPTRLPFSPPRFVEGSLSTQASSLRLRRLRRAVRRARIVAMTDSQNHPMPGNGNGGPATTVVRT